MSDTIEHFYKEKASALEQKIRELESKDRTYLIGEIVAFCAFFFVLLAYSICRFSPIFLSVSAAGLAANIILRFFDARREKVMKSKSILLAVFQKELSYLHGDFTPFDSGERYIDPAHPFSYDLDIFGKDSLFNRINRTVTTGGAERLARALTFESLPKKEDVETLQRAIAELSEETDLRTQFMATGTGSPIDTSQLRESLKKAKEIAVSEFPKSRASLFLTVSLTASLAVTSILAICGVISANYPFDIAFIQYVVSYFCCKKSLKAIKRELGASAVLLERFSALVDLPCHASLKEKANSHILQLLGKGEYDAGAASRGFATNIKDINGRNEIVIALTDSLFMRDFHLLRKFLHWREHYAQYAEDWIEAITRMDTLVSMATYHYNHPENTRAEIVENEDMTYEATAFYHPFLGKNAVPNDFHIQDSHYYIVTGANMAGKSTFLRAVGVNYILALCGMPVCARHLRVSIFSLFSSMRTTDDLTRGISFFKAELLRLQELIAFCKRNKKTLIILDEILRGTNSLDKLNGSRLFLEHISKMPVTGIIATHDLELSKMTDTSPDRYHNYCFEIELADVITYSYKITEGVAQNQNATYLLAKMLEDA